MAVCYDPLKTGKDSKHGLNILYLQLNLFARMPLLGYCCIDSYSPTLLKPNSWQGHRAKTNNASDA